ncbi:hypothetical protein ZOSMA_180G00070 [Zostera marina]|uniref:Uncharacterized protein n=1 Tax=Zostera marina TaxID=29655 RepID=A0A0K9PT36_ZOSMR|nr:hypothetical protein ZOSMA_180G00070 [Zostera marina]
MTCDKISYFTPPFRYRAIRSTPISFSPGARFYFPQFHFEFAASRYACRS